MAHPHTNYSTVNYCVTAVMVLNSGGTGGKLRCSVFRSSEPKRYVSRGASNVTCNNKSTAASLRHFYQIQFKPERYSCPGTSRRLERAFFAMYRTGFAHRYIEQILISFLTILVTYPWLHVLHGLERIDTNIVLEKQTTARNYTGGGVAAASEIDPGSR